MVFKIKEDDFIVFVGVKSSNIVDTCFNIFYGDFFTIFCFKAETQTKVACLYALLRGCEIFPNIVEINTVTNIDFCVIDEYADFTRNDAYIECDKHLFNAFVGDKFTIFPVPYNIVDKNSVIFARRCCIKNCITAQ